MTRNAVAGMESPDRAAQSPDMVLTVRDLRVYYGTDSGVVKAVDGVSLSLQRGERIAIVGESGSGKSTLAQALMRLIQPPGYIASGEVILDGTDLLQLQDEDMRLRRLADIALVPQGAMNSLNPVRKVGEHISDCIEDHKLNLTSKDMRERIESLLKSVDLGTKVSGMYPHELSGGMKQRVAMAIATSMNPKVIVADEPTSALDVVVQRQVMRTLRVLQEERNSGVILIGHDMGLIAQFAHKIGVMYAGKLVEMGPVRQIIGSPLHPYTKLLISSLPTLEKKRTLTGIPGLPPALVNLPPGCSFASRCPHALEKCSLEEPEWTTLDSAHGASCHLVEVGKI